MIYLFLIVFTFSYLRVNHLNPWKYAPWIIVFAPIMLIMGIVAVAR